MVYYRKENLTYPFLTFAIAKPSNFPYFRSEADYSSHGFKIKIKTFDFSPNFSKKSKNLPSKIFASNYLFAVEKYCMPTPSEYCNSFHRFSLIFVVESKIPKSIEINTESNR